MKSTNENLDLFGNAPRLTKMRPTKLESELLKYDKNTFTARLERLKYLHKIYPKGLFLSGDMEFVYTWSEIKECYISGHFISTILLVQAFIEKVFHQFFQDIGEQKSANEGLASMIKLARRKNLINSLILDKVDDLRLKRNPFTHSKDYNYPHTLQRRIIKNKSQPDKQLEQDSKEAIQILFLITTQRL